MCNKDLLAARPTTPEYDGSRWRTILFLSILGIGISACDITPFALDEPPGPVPVCTWPDPCIMEDPSPSQPGFFTAWTWDQCLNQPYPDPDSDGFVNGCEIALAEAFAPKLYFGSDCNLDEARGRPGGDYHWGVEPLNTNIQGAWIVYLPAYYKDCGDGTAGSGHNGDSEFIAIQVDYIASSMHWVTDLVFLSAHCYTPLGINDDYCRYWPATELGWVDYKIGGAPLVFVAVNKHAHYPSLSACFSNDVVSGHIWHENCTNSLQIRFPIEPATNIGSRHDPLINETGPFYPSPMVNPDVLETIWAVDGEFNGWQTYGGSDTNDGPEAYGRYLQDWTSM